MIDRCEVGWLEDICRTDKHPHRLFHDLIFFTFYVEIMSRGSIKPPFLCFLVEWWNWQTRKTKDLVP